MSAAEDDARDEAAERLLAVIPSVRALLHRLCWSNADLDDLTQEVLIEVAKALPRFEGRARLTTYAHTIAVRTAYRWLASRRKRAAREVVLELVPEPAGAMDPESQAMARAALRRLYRCLEELEPELRMAFLLCDVEGLAPTEAAELERIRPGTMRARLFRARRRVHGKLEGDAYIEHLVAGRER